MVHAEQQHVVVIRQPQQPRAEEGAGGQVEGPRRVVPRPAAHLRLALRLVQRGEVIHREDEAGEGRDHLHGRAVLLGERRPQRLVPADDLAERTLQRVPSSAPRSRTAAGTL